VSVTRRTSELHWDALQVAFTIFATFMGFIAGGHSCERFVIRRRCKNESHVMGNHVCWSRDLNGIARISSHQSSCAPRAHRRHSVQSATAYRRPPLSLPLLRSHTTETLRSTQRPLANLVAHPADCNRPRSPSVVVTAIRVKSHDPMLISSPRSPLPCHCYRSSIHTSRWSLSGQIAQHEFLRRPPFLRPSASA
jgi:hypothetical protein